MENDKLKILIGLSENDKLDEIVKVLSKRYAIEIVYDSEEAYNKIHIFDPDLAILDYSLSKVHPIDLHEGISLVHSHVQLVICVTNENFEVASRIWSKRAMDFILKPFSADRFIQDVNKIIRYIIDKRELENLRKKIKYYENRIITED